MNASWAELRQRCARRLAASPANNPEQEALWITEDCSGHSGHEWLEIARRSPTERQEAAVLEIVRRRVLGQPLQYLLGHWQFGSLDLRVTEDVLIPRPETEQFVEALLASLPRTAAGWHPFRHPEWTAVDLGTGSGAIALSIAAARPDAAVIAVEQSSAALAVARANAAGLGSAATHVQFRLGSWFDALEPALQGQVQMIAANPPYLSPREWVDLDDEVAAYEPREALVSGPSGLEDLEHIITVAPTWLAAGGTLGVEHGDHQQAAVISLMRRTQQFEHIAPGKDLAGRDRFVLARRRDRANDAERSIVAVECCQEPVVDGEPQGARKRVPNDRAE